MFIRKQKLLAKKKKMRRANFLMHSGKIYLIPHLYHFLCNKSPVTSKESSRQTKLHHLFKKKKKLTCCLLHRQHIFRMEIVYAHLLRMFLATAVLDVISKEEILFPRTCCLDFMQSFARITHSSMKPSFCCCIS